MFADAANDGRTGDGATEDFGAVRKRDVVRPGRAIGPRRDAGDSPFAEQDRVRAEVNRTRGTASDLAAIAVGGHRPRTVPPDLHEPAQPRWRRAPRARCGYQHAVETDRDTGRYYGDGKAELRCEFQFRFRHHHRFCDDLLRGWANVDSRDPLGFIRGQWLSDIPPNFGRRCHQQHAVRVGQISVRATLRLSRHAAIRKAQKVQPRLCRPRDEIIGD